MFDPTQCESVSMAQAKAQEEQNPVNAALRATSIAFVTLAESGQIDDTTATENVSQFASWAYPVTYAVGNIRQYMLVFLCAYLANVAFSLWYNIKIRKEDFDREKLIASGLKILVFVVGLTLLCTAITALPIFANEVGWAIPDEYTDIFADLVIIGAVLLVSCKYIKEAFTKFVAILNTGSVENVENVSEPEATNAGKVQIGFMAGNGGNENE